MKAGRLFDTVQTRAMMGTGRDEVIEVRDKLSKTLSCPLISLDFYLNGYGESLSHFKQETDRIR